MGVVGSYVSFTSMGTIQADTPVQPGKTPATTAPAVLGTWAPPLFVWGTWLLMFVLALKFVSQYGSNVFVADEWVTYTAYLTGDEPHLLRWLWAPVLDHRHPMPKLVFLGLFKTTHDERTAMFLMVVVLGILAVTMIQATRKIRGWTSYADAFFPVLLLHVGHAETIVWCFQSCFLTPFIAAAGTILLLMVWPGATLKPTAALVSVVSLVVLALCGPLGLAYTPSLGLWLIYSGFRHWRSPGSLNKWCGLGVWLSVLASLSVLVLYLLRFEKHPASTGFCTDPSKVFLAAVQFLAVAFGAAVDIYWPASGVIAFGLLILSLLALVTLWVQQPRRRQLVTGLLFFLGGIVALSASIGLARAEFEGGGAGWRYTIMALPFAFWVYFVWVIYGGRASHLVEMLLFCLVILMVPANTTRGHDIGQIYRNMTKPYERDVAAGIPISILIERQAPNLTPLPEADARELISRELNGLHSAGVMPYRLLKKDPRFRKVEAALDVMEMNQMTWADGIGEGTGDSPRLGLALQNPSFVYAIQLKCSYSATGSPASFRVFWEDSHRIERPKQGEEETFVVDTESGEKTLTAWVNNSIDRISLEPDSKPCSCRISNIVFFVREVDGQR
jgi:hypothetical protein